MRCIGHRLQHFNALLGRRRFADDMKAVRNERVFKFEHGFRKLADGVGLIDPRRFRLRQFQRARLSLDQGCKAGPFIAILRRQTAPARDRGLEFDQTLVKAGMRDRRRQIADQGGRRAALGDRAFGRIVGRIEIKVRQVADHPVRPARAGQARLLARHEFERAMGAEMQHRAGAEILAQPAIERREGMRRRKALLEQQPHRIAFISEGGLDADKDVPEALAQHEDRTAVALLLAGRRTPLRLDLAQPFFRSNMIAGRNSDVDIGVGAEAGGVADHDPLPQRVGVGRHIDLIALALHRGERAMQGLEHRQEGGRAGVARIRREIEQHDRHLAIPSLGAPHRNQTRGPRRQHVGALAADMHLAADFGAGEGAGALASGAGNAGAIGTSAIDHRPGRAIEFGDRDHDGAFHRHQPAIRRAPLLQRLEFDGMRRQIRYVEPGQNILGRLGVIIGRAADQREAGQRYHRVDHAAAVLHEEALDCRPLVEAAGKHRNDAQSPGFEGRYHAVIVAGVSGQQIGPQQQKTDGAFLVGDRQAADPRSRRSGP